MAPWWVGGLLDELFFVRLMMNFPPSSVDDLGINMDKDKDSSSENSPRHQGEKIAGGNKENYRVLHCSNLDFSLNFEEIHMLMKQFGKVERIRIKLIESDTSLESFIVFANSESAAKAYSQLNGHIVNFSTVKTRL